jgi:hypothetical protein
MQQSCTREGTEVSALTSGQTKSGIETVSETNPVTT